MNSSIVVTNIAKSFGDHQVLQDVSFTVQEGTIFALLGANGAGKTTAINILSTLMLPDSGDATVGGFSVITDDKKVRQNISLTGQYAAVDELLTGYENMIMMGKFSHIDPAVVRPRTTTLLAQLDLTDAANRPAQTYSGGMRRRLDLAISLLASPPIIFLDEPTTGLDPRSRKEIWRIIKELVANGTTVFLTTQYLEEADQLADTIAVLHDGRIVAQGTAQDLKDRVGGELVELSFTKPTAFQKAHTIIANTASSDSATLTLHVATDGSPKALRELLDQLSQGGAEPSKVALHSPSLDDVFMNLTDTQKGKQ